MSDSDPARLSPKKREALWKLRAAVADVPDKPEDDDYFYLRWLRARSWNVAKAEEMLRNHIQFRKELGVDTIIEDWTPPEVLRKCFPGGFFGEDRDGHPVWYDSVGNMDFRGLHRSAKKEDIVKLKVVHLETTIRVCKEFSRRKGRKIEKVTSVWDLENLSYQKHFHWPAINLFREILALFEANYPERTKQIIIVKAPKIFPIAYNLVKHFMHEYTREKIVVLGSDWQEELQRYIAPDQLPQAFGGARCEPDPWCTDYINPGYDVPPEFYLTNLTETSKEEMERVVVGRGSSHEVEYQVDLPGTALRWELVSTDHDISYGWLHKPDGEKKKKQIVPMKRRNSHVIPENGIHTCKTSGTYVLKFDNSYSWTRSKEVFYSVKVLPPDTELSMPPSSASGPSPSDSEDEFHDCMDDFTAEDGLDQQNGLTGSAEVGGDEEMQDEASATGAAPYIIRDSIQTTV